MEKQEAEQIREYANVVMVLRDCEGKTYVGVDVTSRMCM